MTAREVIESLFGAKVDYEDAEFIEQYRFYPDGWVTGSLGHKSAVTGPLLKYRVIDDNSVEIESLVKGRFELWEQLKIEGDLLTLLYNGRPKTYRIVR
jgi:hypothetical protein